MEYLIDNYKSVRKKAAIAISLLVVFNIAAWIIAYAAFHDSPKLLILCLIAYGFGLRHAVDADHIAAIDNVTRKFLYNKKYPVGVGFFFSIGHSTIVVLMSLIVALGTIYMKSHLSNFQEIGGLIGTLVSSAFLLVIALINFMIFIDTYKSFLAYRRSGGQSDDIQNILVQKGVMTSLFRPLFRFVNKSWHMYIVGFLFGLGFDTSTEVALLGISATQAATNLSVWSIMVFPVLFMSGMSLIDTLDGILMINVYGWAMVKPARKLFYNMAITLLSFCVALFIGSLEALSIISEKLGLNNGFWAYINSINNNFDYMGFYIVGIFILCWVLAIVASKFIDRQSPQPCKYN
ncbi:MAG TPA: HoxN/HupN/NixA family nickel/cobalt transporter [Lentisphaeria bacterium]|nr:MAG: nickel transporter [Lentisphaerae bacterium GWF2_38_69]HBM17506.1 HoxN/HupN/NixA family nickel/cobalt transporter [Lentisphaeria bacterium]